MTKSEIAEIVINGIEKGYSHVCIYCDHWDYTYSHQYVKEGENIQAIINRITSGGSPGMFTIEEVYNYQLDIKMQLQEKRAYHIEPTKKAKTEEELVEEALEYATQMHKGQYRKDGREYITHPIQVAEYVSKFIDSPRISILKMASYLHDTVEDTKATYENILKRFGPEVASLVLELTTDEDLKNEIGKTRYLQIKMKNMSSEALDIKLCDRLANVVDLINTDKDFQEKYTKETLEILNYLIDHRTLSKIQTRIIRYILFHIHILNYQYPIEHRNTVEKVIK